MNPSFPVKGQIAPMTTKKSCPLCRLAMTQPGYIAAARDDANQAFVFVLCHRCEQRLSRLRVVQRSRQFDIAISNLERHPERYELQFFDSDDAAKIYIALETERINSAVI